MNSWIVVLLCVMWALAAGGIGWYCATVARQITYITLADGRRQERSLPLMFRLLLPLTPNLTPYFRKPAFQKTGQKVRRAITAAGFEDLLSAEEFMALRILVPFLLGCVWLLFARGLVAVGPEFMQRADLPLAVIGLLWLAAYPGMWLKSVLAARHKSIQRALPFVLDLLTLSVEAGMDFMSALQRNVERRALDALGEELIRVIREIQIGKTRRDALRDMSKRVNLANLSSVVNALVQADELGVSVGSILRIQADQLRQRRFERAERLANEAPVKMLFPLMFFIFPSVFLILLGPIIYRLLQQVS